MPLALLPAFPACTGAWLQAPGHGILIAQAAYTVSDEVVSATGTRTDQEPYRQFVESLYGEAGLTPEITVGAAANLIQSSQYAPTVGRDARASALTDPSLFARTGLLRQGAHRLSLQGLVQLPRQRIDESGLTLGNPESEYELALQYGYGRTVTTPWGAWPAFVDAHLGYRLRAGRPEDQWRTYLTGGVTPLPDIQLLLQAFGTWRSAQDGAASAFTQSSGDDYDQLRLQAGLVWDVTAGWSMQGAYFRDVYGRNLGLSEGALVGVWKKF